MRLILKSSIAALAFLFATGAEASSGLATANINLRTGPGTQYPSIGRIPNGVVIGVAGCTNGYGWCRVNYSGLDGWASSRYIAVQTGRGGYTTNDNFGSTAAAIGIPLIAGLAIGSAINNNGWNDGPGWGPRPYRGGWGRPGWGRPGWGRPGWGPGPFRPGPNWRGPGHWGPPRPHWGDRPGWRDHPGYHPNFFGPGNRWRPR
ncbi:SH3 domain-containing protein [Brucella gallinifaecis]|uniref:SH3 domain-containing protein n=1 Tax=Brucella gallinifaecis TaxID=215590 RepID=A0A502BQS9_9HYPH|nr:SH3 domain-containing protein [Brucella gallinifaecis]TPF76564.1 SH3 domain-containing protein [Brucella gallinifaecis]